MTAAIRAVQRAARCTRLLRAPPIRPRARRSAHPPPGVRGSGRSPEGLAWHPRRDPPSLDPAGSTNTSAAVLLELIFDRLLTYDYLARPAKLMPLAAAARPARRDIGQQRRQLFCFPAKWHERYAKRKEKDERHSRLFRGELCHLVRALASVRADAGRGAAIPRDLRCLAVLGVGRSGRLGLYRHGIL